MRLPVWEIKLRLVFEFSVCCAKKRINDSFIALTLTQCKVRFDFLFFD